MIPSLICQSSIKFPANEPLGFVFMTEDLEKTIHLTSNHNQSPFPINSISNMFILSDLASSISTIRPSQFHDISAGDISQTAIGLRQLPCIQEDIRHFTKEQKIN
ncbi:hypothetical protein RF11_06672 [Thelohanellus kitauei]|uniref:Uncharacterized protein n=1 Tax=Thelohanellus kitauei TaxID=669202 RepID=A0A0C2MJC1_THEKT|nr:hypothetical protein RF11_06672 [Thelohanellus kitauei]